MNMFHPECYIECYTFKSWWNLFMVTWWRHFAKHYGQSCFHNNLHRHLYFARVPDKRYCYRHRHREPGANRYCQL